MIEARQDKSNPCVKLIPLEERQIFNSLKRHFGVEDNQRLPQSLKFFWNNLCTDGVRVLA
jgi:hypothetical protein